MQKRIISLFLAIMLTTVLAVSLTACKTAQNNENTTGGQTETTQTEQNDSTKIAVVFFSATGTTAEAANLIADETGAARFEIVPQEAYTPEDLNYTDDNCRANQEMGDTSARPAIKNDLSQAAEYDTIYLGYPIWHGTAPRIIQTFLENYNLNDATVYLFCTSGGSGIEQSIQDLQRSYPDINIAGGKRFNGADEAEAKEWLDGLK